ncbi:GNAT family N-acetyltransferase, partial [Jiangella anatolica]
MSNANPNSNNTVLIRQLSSVDAADVADYRAIRLAALKDSPDAFGSTYEAEVGLSTEAFAERLATTIVLGAYAGTGSDARIVGMVGFKQQRIAKLAHKGFV